jgi:hypothetical protein
MFKRSEKKLAQFDEGKGHAEDDDVKKNISKCLQLFYVMNFFYPADIHFTIDFKDDKMLRVGANHKLKPKKRGIALRIDNDMNTMDWLRKFKKSLRADKLEYKFNEYESSGFDAVNIKMQDSIVDNKIDAANNEKKNNKYSLKNLDFSSIKGNSSQFS